MSESVNELLRVLSSSNFRFNKTLAVVQHIQGNIFLFHSLQKGSLVITVILRCLLSVYSHVSSPTTHQKSF